MRPKAVQPAELEDEVDGDDYRKWHALAAAANMGKGSAGRV